MTGRSFATTRETSTRNADRFVGSTGRNKDSRRDRAGKRGDVPDTFDLYRIETSLRESRVGPALRQAIRSAESRMITSRLHRYLTNLFLKHKILPESPFGKAASYALSMWKDLDVILENGHIELDNNLVENQIRPIALGRKNWMFIGDRGAGWRSATIYSVVQSCKTYGVEPYEYLHDILTRLPAMTNQQVGSVTPREWAAARLQNLAS